MSWLARHALLIIVLAMASHSALGTDWPAWRGDGTGVSSETNLPWRWNRDINVAWRTELPGEGNSSPIVAGGRIYLTAALDKGKKRLVLCLDSAKGNIIWKRELDADAPGKTHAKNGYASPTCLSDGKRVYAFFDSPGLVALDLEGNVLWTRPFGPFKGSWNLASSPVLCGENIILMCDHRGESFLAAISAATGEVAWRTVRRGKESYATPLVIEHGGTKQVVISGQKVIAYDAATGKDLWSCKGLRETCVPTPLYRDALVWVTSGRDGPTLAIDPSGTGDVTETHVRAQVLKGGPYVPSAIWYPNLLLPGDDGRVMMLDPAGKVLLDARVKGHFTASPVAGDGRIYWPTEKGLTYVFDANALKGDKPALNVLAVNDLGEKMLASLAIAGGRLFIRTAKAIYCIYGDAPVPVATSQAAQESFDDLKARFADYDGKEGDDVTTRIEIVGEMEKLDDSQAVPFLLGRAMDKNEHWDVSAAAAAGLGRMGPRAADALIELTRDGRPHVKCIACEGLGQVASPAAMPRLLELATDADATVRVAGLRAGAQIAQNPQVDAQPLVAALVAALNDAEGAVRVGAIQAIASLGPRLAGQRDAVISQLSQRAGDSNPLVANAAREALATLGSK